MAKLTLLFVVFLLWGTNVISKADVSEEASHPANMNQQHFESAKEDEQKKMPVNRAYAGPGVDLTFMFYTILAIVCCYCIIQGILACCGDSTDSPFCNEQTRDQFQKVLVDLQKQAQKHES